MSRRASLALSYVTAGFLAAGARGRVVGRVEGRMDGGSPEIPDAVSVRFTVVAGRCGELSSAALGSRPPLGAVRAVMARRRFGLLGSWEVDGHRFVLAALLDLAALRECALVGLGRRLLDHE